MNQVFAPSMPRSRSIQAGLAAGALWGLVFVLPLWAPAFTAIEFTVGRYAVYGLLSLLALLVVHRGSQAALLRRQVSMRTMVWAFGLGVLGNTLYYAAVVLAVRSAGPALTGLIIGTIPVWVMFLGRPASLNPKHLLIGGLCTLLGLGLMVMTQQAKHADDGSLGLGLLWAILAMVCWTAYAVGNAHFLSKHPHLPLTLWTHLVGAATLVSTLPLLFFLPRAPLEGERANTWLAFAVAITVMGLGSSWLATWLWNIASRHLPTSLAGQLIVSETLFALIFTAMVEKRWPNAWEWAAATLFIVGILVTIRAHGRGPSGVATKGQMT